MKRALWISVAALSSAASCAVLTVDVDVYKGPLANHETVQVEQLAAMAIGARPLLIELRDQLVTQALASKCEDKANFKCRTGYARGTVYVRGMRPTLDSRARVVNAVLGLYENKRDASATDPELQRLLAEGTALIEAMRETTDSGQNDDREALAYLDSTVARVVGSQEFLTGLRALFEGGHRRDIDKIYTATHTHIASQTFGPIAFPSAEDASANTKFGLLASRAEAERIATQTLAPRPPPGVTERLANHIQAAGANYLELRGQIATGLLLTLNFIRKLDERPDLPRKKEAIAAAASIAAELIQGRWFVAALSDQGGGRPLDLGADGFLRRHLKLEDEALWTLERARWTKPEYDSVGRSIENLLNDYPTQASTAMITVHHRLRRSQDVLGATVLGDAEKADMAARQFGIARGPTLDAQSSESIEDKFEGLRRTGGLLQSILSSDLGFDGGRPDLGLVSLIDAHIAKGGQDNASRHIDPELRNALTHFAQKVLFVVNHDQLLRPDARKHEDTIAYTQILQAVGNSILTLLDEREHARTYDEAARKPGGVHAKRELAAARAVWSPTPQEVIESLDDVLADTERLPAELLAATRVALDDARKVEKEKQAALDLEDRRCSLRSFKQASTKPFVGTWKSDTTAAETSTRGRLDSLVSVLEKETSVRPDEDVKEALTLLATHATALVGRPTTNRSEALAHFGARLTEILSQGASLDTTLACDPQTKSSELDTAKAAVRAASDALANAKRDLRKLAQSQVASVKDAALAASSKRPGRANRGEVIGFLLDALRAKSDPEADKAAKIVLENSFTFRAELSPGEEAKCITDAIDQVISGLRHLHIRRVLDEGQDDEIAKQISDAIDLAAVYRSPMVYIRPPQAYLRNSYPVTSLQQNQVAWKNELSAMFGRTLGNGELDDAQRHQVRVLAEIDKQFWQNINRVQVSGFGKSNYALAKDDIGNWYVKEYSSDPESVFRGARSIALAGMSGSLGTDTFDRLKAVQDAREKGTPYKPGSYPSVLGRHVERFTQRYDEDTKKQSDEFRKQAGNVPTKLNDAWKAHPDWTASVSFGDRSEFVLPDDVRKELEAAVDSARVKFLSWKDLPNTATPEDRAKDCRTTIGALLDFEESVLTKLEAKLIAPTQAVDAAKKADADEQAKLTAGETALGTKQALADAAKRAVVRSAEEQRRTQTALDAARGGGDPAAIARAEAANDQARASLTGAQAVQTTADQDVTTATAEVAALKQKAGELQTALARQQELLVRRQALRRALRQDVDDTAGKLIRSFLEQRADAVTNYQTALDVLGAKAAPAEDAAPSPAPATTPAAP